MKKVLSIEKCTIDRPLGRYKKEQLIISCSKIFTYSFSVLIHSLTLSGFSSIHFRAAASGAKSSCK